MFGGAGWLFGSQIAMQFDFVVETLPRGFSQFVQDFGANPWGEWLLGLARDVNLTSETGQAAGYIAALFGSVLRAPAYIVVLLFASVYPAAQPQRYRHGLLQLVPRDRRTRIGEVLDLMGETRKKVSTMTSSPQPREYTDPKHGLVRAATRRQVLPASTPTAPAPPPPMKALCNHSVSLAS